MASSPYQKHIYAHQGQYTYKPKFLTYYGQYKVVLRFRKIQILLYTVSKPQACEASRTHSQQRLNHLPAVSESVGERIQKTGKSGKSVPFSIHQYQSYSRHCGRSSQYSHMAPLDSRYYQHSSGYKYHGEGRRHIRLKHYQTCIYSCQKNYRNYAFPEVIGSLGISVEISCHENYESQLGDLSWHYGYRSCSQPPDSSVDFYAQRSK